MEMGRPSGAHRSYGVNTTQVDYRPHCRPSLPFWRADPQFLKKHHTQKSGEDRGTGVSEAGEGGCAGILHLGVPHDSCKCSFRLEIRRRKGGREKGKKQKKGKKKDKKGQEIGSMGFGVGSQIMADPIKLENLVGEVDTTRPPSEWL